MTVDVMRRLYNPFSLSNNLYWISTKINERFNRSQKLVLDHLEGLVDTRRQLPVNDRPHDLLNYIVAAHLELASEQETPDDKTVGDMLIPLLFAGYNTTTVTLIYVFYVLAIESHMQATMLEEIRRCGVESVDNLAYTCAV